MGDFTTLFSLIIAGYGIYFLYEWFQVKIRKRPLECSKFLPSDLKPNNCTDFEDFTSSAMPWLLGSGLFLIAYAAADLLWGKNPWFFLITIGLFVLVIVAYSAVIRQARSRFWPQTVKKKP